jgi:tRNA A37 threonylcarbamoyladenosine dehydratase
LSSNPIFHRLELLVGGTVLERLQATKVILFGVGGVGGWCAEGLIRSGIGELTIVDSDLICATNINRQLQAHTGNVGKVKVDELASRLSSINPAARITALQKVYNRDSAGEFNLSEYGYVVDAIDSLSPKVELISNCMAAGLKLYCALGASCKLDPTAIRVDSIWNTKGCHLGRFVRKRLRRRNVTGDCTCVYSEEMLPLQPVASGCGTGKCVCPKFTAEGEPAHEWCSSKKLINGSAVHITATFGFFLSGLIVQDVYKGFRPQA